MKELLYKEDFSMAEEFFAHLLDPYERSQHGGDSPDRLTRPSFLPTALDGDHSPLGCLSNFFTVLPFSFISAKSGGACNVSFNARY
jgi:hypothetical protein